MSNTIYTNPPQSRNESILRAIIDGTQYTDPPQSRIEDLLLELKDAIESGDLGFKAEVVSTLPATGAKNTIYLVPNSGGTPNIYDEYIYVNNTWEKIGTTDIDLTQYYTKSEIDTMLGSLSYSNLSDKPQIAGTELSGNKTLSDLGIQAELEFDTAPTEDSLNPVTSGGLYAELTPTVISKSGNPIAISDACALDCKTLEMDIEASQDLNGYDKPWVGGAGKNKLDNHFRNTAGVFDTTGEIVFSDTTTTRMGNDDFTYLQAGTYTISCTVSGLMMNFYKYTANDVSGFVGVGMNAYTNLPFTFTLSENLYVRFFARNTDNTDIIPSDYPNIQVEQGSTATTFAPYSNICPITGISTATVQRVGKNKIDWKVNTTANALSVAMPSGNYVLSAESELANGNWYIRVTKSDTTYAGETELGLTGWTVASSGWVYGANTSQVVPFTIPSGATLLEIGKQNADGTIYAQLEQGTTATSYEPYAGQTATITLGETVYGGTVDFNTGVVSVTHAVEDLGTKEYSYNDTALTFSSTLDAGERYNTSEQANAISSAFNCVSNAVLTGDLTLDASFSIHYAIEHNWVNIRCLQYGSDTNAFRTAMSGAQVVYKLATPRTLTLTPSQLELLASGQTVSGNGAEIRLSYLKRNLAGQIIEGGAN